MKNIIYALILCFAFESHAALSPISLNIVPPAQFPPSDFNVTGLRTSLLWGRQRDVTGIDLGLIGNITDQKFTGLAVSGLFNYTGGESTAVGAQIAGLTNINKQKISVYGIQAALGANVNPAESSVTGLQFALVNWSPHTTIYGLQAGLYNKARTVYGLQIGLINVAESLRGIQIGVMNFHTKGIFVVSPILNIGF